MQSVPPVGPVSYHLSRYAQPADADPRAPQAAAQQPQPPQPADPDGDGDRVASRGIDVYA